MSGATGTFPVLLRRFFGIAFVELTRPESHGVTVLILSTSCSYFREKIIIMIYDTMTIAHVLVGHVAHVHLVGINQVSSAHARAAPRARTP